MLGVRQWLVTPPPRSAPGHHLFHWHKNSIDPILTSDRDLVCDVDWDLLVKQKLYASKMAAKTGVMQRRPAVVISDADVRVFLQQVIKYRINTLHSWLAAFVA